MNMAKRRTFLTAKALAVMVVTVAACGTNNSRPNVTVNAGCVGCAINANAAATAPKPAVTANNLVVTVPNDPTSPVVYIWHNRSYQGADAFLQVARAEVAASLEKVKPSASPPYGSLKVAFPKRPPPPFDKQQNPAGVAEAGNTWTQFWQVIDDGRLKAIEKSKLFTSITSEVANVSILDVGAADYALWFDGGFWHVRYHKGNPVDLTDISDVVTWVGSLNVMAKSVKATEGDIFSWHMSQAQGNQKVWLTVLG
jgi:hypothetical protein